MKKITTTLFALLILFAVRSNAQESKAETMQAFLKDIPALASEKIASIEKLTDVAAKKASKTIVLTKENIKESLKEAEGKTCIVVVEHHTFAKFSDTKKCNMSGSWAACMPYAEGYVQSGGLKSINDYMNNIIGKPDDQNRTLYIF